MIIFYLWKNTINARLKRNNYCNSTVLVIVYTQGRRDLQAKEALPQGPPENRGPPRKLGAPRNFVITY